jgi:hypothetical protein
MSEDGMRTQLHETIQRSIAIDDTLPDGTLLLGWCTVAEWMAPDGMRWLTIIDSDARGHGCPAWQRQGYLHNALFDTFTDIEDEHEEQDE